MRIVFFGTPEFAIPSLEAIEGKYELLAVVTAADKPAGRGHQLSQSAVKNWAESRKVPVLQPRNLHSEKFRNKLKSYNADLFVVVAFRKLPESLLSVAKFGAINVHASLLPKYRGAAPIQRAIMAGERISGVSIFKLVNKIDEGDILLQEECPVGAHMTGGELYDLLKIRGSILLLKSIDLIKSGKFTLIKQNEAEASPAPKIFREDSEINWLRNGEDIYNQIRALLPHPCAWFKWRDKPYKIHKARFIKKVHDVPVGEFVKVGKDLFVPCSNGFLQIFMIQMEGKRIMSAEEFINGFLKN